MSAEIRSHKRPAIDQMPPQPKPPSILRLKDDYVPPEHEQLVRLTLATGSSYQSPPKKPPPPPPLKSPPHPSLLQLIPPSSSANTSRSPQPPLESQPHPSFLQLLSQFSSSSRSPPQPPFSLGLPLSQLQPPALPVPAPPKSQPHPSLLLPSSSSPYSGPPPGFHFSMPSSSRQLHMENVSTQKPQAQPSPPEQPEPADQIQPPEGQAHGSGARRARNYQKPGWELTIEPPYPWASNMRAKVLSIDELISKDILVITGDVYCKECKKQFQMQYDLLSKFSEVVSFLVDENDKMHNRAPEVWLKPEDLDCNLCNKSRCVQPVISDKKRGTNWLFLFLGQMIGFCNLPHLRYFCKHTGHHRTAAKDRLVYLAFITLHCQLDPEASDLYN
ncbi:formin-like protein 5 [Neltuma alba]|uniref:formin-like protein 5 n=1 Tax=Neltuma alba TaxID=207710 RepID=UPI0010A342A0|nr:formin-like protein 5 [Prosopis alba]